MDGPVRETVHVLLWLRGFRWKTFCNFAQYIGDKTETFRKLFAPTSRAVVRRLKVA